jgi:2'-5' RNA ligase
VRLFLAVEVDAAVRSALARTLDELRIALDAVDPAATGLVKWVRPDRAHVTLHFLGEVPVEVVDRLERSLAVPLATPPFTVEFGGVGAFPAGPTPPRVVWLGCTRGTDGLRALHRELAGRLAESSCAWEARPLSPHLTLGRFRVPGPVRAREAWEGAAPVPVAACRVAAVTLFESRLSAAGPHYTTRLHIPLVA